MHLVTCKESCIWTEHAFTVTDKHSSHIPEFCTMFFSLSVFFHKISLVCCASLKISFFWTLTTHALSTENTTWNCSSENCPVLLDFWVPQIEKIVFIFFHKDSVSFLHQKYWDIFFTTNNIRKIIEDKGAFCLKIHG